MHIMNWIDDNMEAKNMEIKFEGEVYRCIDVICQHNNIPYSRLLILDLINETNLQELFTNDMSYEKYKEFEKVFLEDIFFLSRGDNRFNIYLIFLMPDEKIIKSKYEIQKDFQFARKLFLDENEMENYFRDGISLKRYKSNNNFIAYDKQKILRELYQSKDIVRDLCGLQLKIGLLMDNRKPKQIKLQNEMLLSFSAVEKCLGEEIYSKEKMKKNSRVAKQEKRKLSYIAEIRKVDIRNYRCFDKCDIPFKKVNLLYGENGVGKTTILEAIELGITGQNRDNSNNQDAISRVYCIDEENREYILSNENLNIDLSDFWYNVKSQNCKEFNELFHRFNYFDTNWVSEFAIEGKTQVNINQLQKYLGIEKIENGKQALIFLYEKLAELAKINLRANTKRMKSITSFLDKPQKLIYKRNMEQMMKETSATIETCNEQLAKLKNESNVISIDMIFDKHISKIEDLFKLLVAANEFTGLDFCNGEIGALIKSSKNEVKMSQMSTGQKICFALSLMFALFLSLDRAPNIVMLDEPVANLDDMHMLNLLDVLRRLAIAGTQIFFTTANPDVAKLFRRKFSFLENDFAFYRINEIDNNTKIVCEEYSLYKEEAEFQKNIL